VDKREIVRTVLCCVVYDSCAQWYANTYEQFLKMGVGLGLGLVFVHLFRFSALCVFLVQLRLFCFYVVGGASPKCPLLCRSLSPSF